MSERAPTRGAPGTAWNDPKMPGLRLRHFASKSVWYLYLRTRAGQQRNIKIGDARDFTLTAARERASELRRAVATGADPVALDAAHKARPTMADLRDKHLAEHADVKLKPRTAKGQRQMWETHILPALGAETAVADVTTAAIADLHHRMRKTPYQANRVAALLSKAFRLSERWGWRPRRSSPVDVEFYREHKRRRLPKGDEPVRLLVALHRMRAAQPWFVGLIELQCFTGVRISEILTAKWEWVTDDGLHLPDSKTGERVITLSSYARALLAEIPRVDGNPYIIAGRRIGRPLVGYPKMWRALLADAGIKNLRTHDLRRFFASAALSGDVALDKVGRLLGHSNTQTTLRYAYLLTADAQESAESAGQKVRQLMTGGGKVVMLTPKR